MIDGVSFTATYDDQDRILTYGSRTYTHNNNGDLTRIQWNVTDRTDIAYDVMGNVKQVTLPTGTNLYYAWDGYNRWVGKYSSPGLTFVVGNLYEDQYRISASLNASAQYVREYVYATKVNVPDYLIMSGLKYRMITDHLGSPRLLVRTDNGTVTQRMDYNTLGLVTADSNPTIHPFGFAGGLWDAQTMTIRFGARTYDPRATGRWMTKDPIRFDGGDTNLYGYVLNDPINFIDPTGLQYDAAACFGRMSAAVGLYILELDLKITIELKKKKGVKCEDDEDALKDLLEAKRKLLDGLRRSCRPGPYPAPTAPTASR